MKPLDAYLDAAAGRPGLWRLVLGFGLVTLVWLACTAAVLALPVGWRVATGIRTGVALEDLRQLLAGGSPPGIALMLATFCGLWIGLAVTLPLLHGRRFRSLIGPGAQHRGPTGAAGPVRAPFLRGVSLAVAAYAVSLGLAVAVGGLPERSSLPLGMWLVWLGPIAALVFVQASGEELVFRGYLLQELGRRARHPAVWAGLPSALFGLLHYNPSLPGATGLLYVAVTFVFGLAAALLVARTGGIAAAMGLHTGMNLCGLTLVGLEGTISGSQLWLYPRGASEPLFYADLAVTAGLLLLLLSPASPFPARGAARS